MTEANRLLNELCVPSVTRTTTPQDYLAVGLSGRKRSPASGVYRTGMGGNHRMSMRAA